MTSVDEKLLLLASIISFLVSALTIDIAVGTLQENENLIDYPLPKTVKPEFYDIIIHEINFATSSFLGSATIIATVLEDTSRIIFHCGKFLKCNVETLTVISPSLGEIAAIDVSQNVTTEKILIQLLKKTLKKTYRIEIQVRFKGKLRSNMIGFYKSLYFDDKNIEKVLAVTQFEATYARHAFPCFDEPDLKASFKLSLIVPAGYSCISNMPLIEQYSNNNSSMSCKFKTSIKMSTYLVAFVVSDFTFSELTMNDIKIQLWSREATKHQRSYALDVAGRSLKYFENYFSLRYPIAKKDFVAVPDFVNGAMENWGLVTSQESNLLFDKTHTSAIDEQQIFRIVVHEVAHQWFGNLVTPEKWSYLWLSETFARYFDYMASDVLQPEWKLKEQFLINLQSALYEDSFENSKAMTRVAISTSEIESMPGTITYDKGASVIRMVELVFGHNNYREAFKSYLMENRWASVKPCDLWGALQNQINKTNPNSQLKIDEIMDSWTTRPGYPLVSVSVTPEEITFNQERFFLRNPNGIPTNETKWHVPITWISSNDNEPARPVFWLSESRTNVKNENKVDWIILNSRSTGFYRVLYDNVTLNKIIAILKENHTKIDAPTRAALVDDFLNLAIAQKLDYETALEGIEYLKKERHYLPIKSAFDALDHWIKKFSSSIYRKIFESYVLSLIVDCYKNLTFDDKKDDDHLTILLRQELNNRACSLEHPECVARSMNYFSDWRINKNLVPKNQRSAVYPTAMRHGTEDDWNFLWEQYELSNVATEQQTILLALGHSRNFTILEKYLLNAISKPYKDSLIRKTDLKTVIKGIQSASEENAYFLVEFAEKHHSLNGVAGLIAGALKAYPTKRLTAKVQEIIDGKKISGNLLQSLESSLPVENLKISVYEGHSDLIINKVIKSQP